MDYHRTKQAPLYLVLVAVGIGMLAGAWFRPQLTFTTDGNSANSIRHRAGTSTAATRTL